MGSCLSPDKNSKMIDFRLEECEKYEKSYHKLLFLGPGGGGKSTIFKQLQYLHGDGFTPNTIGLLKYHINIQIVKQMRTAIKHYLSEQTPNIALQKAINTVNHYDLTSKAFKLTKEVVESIAFIWENDERLNGIFDEFSDEQILWPTTQYFLDELDRISAPDYVPTKLDIMKVRNMTTGVIQKRFCIRANNFHVFDVGGQKSERKKWIKCFDNVTAMIFVVDLSCYHELMFEDQRTNCMVDSINLFKNTINDPHFIKTPIILFLNKTDLFKKKIKSIPITVCPMFDDFVFEEETVFDDNEADNNYYNQSTAFIKAKFVELNTSRRPFYTHLTCAMDDGNINHVFDAVVKIVLSDLLKTL